jgi:Protein of unknown function (DUF4232)
MRSATALLAAGVLMAAAACSSTQPSSRMGAATRPPTSGRSQPDTTAPESTSQPRTKPTRRGSTPLTRCRTNELSLRLGSAGAAAGSSYRPIVFTNAGSDGCTLLGYPGISFVAPGTGKQIGAAATRNPEHPTVIVTLAPGATASALVQIVDYHNYPPADCHPTSISGLRVYPPGDTSAAYIPYRSVGKACSSQVHQLSVEAVLPGATGQ